MAHYAFLDENNLVIEVITGVDEYELIEDKPAETWYGEFRNKKCKRTSYNTLNNTHILGGTPFRGNYAGIGYTYDETWDIFIPPKPLPSFIMNYEIADWEPPVPKPEPIDGFIWRWSEPNIKWIKVQVTE